MATRIGGRSMWVAVGFLALLGGCSDGITPPIREAPEPMFTAASGELVRQSTAYSRADQLAREVALALSDPEVRQLVYRSLKSSPVREGKVHFGRWTDAAGTALLETIGRNGRVAGGPSGAKALRDGVVPLELYMPVKAHRKAWRGGPELLVATALRDHELPIVYDLSGQRIQIASADIPPSAPVLALVPLETDFDATSGIAASEESCDPATSIIPCEEPPSGGEFGTPPTDPGIYMRFSYIQNDHEGWLMGDPELEILPSYRLNSGAQTMTFNQCSGALAGQAGRQGPGVVSTAYQFDQNDSYHAGYVLILSAAQLNQARAVDSAINYWVIEDDNTACSVVKNAGDVTDYIVAAGGFVAGTLVAFVNLLTDPLSVPANWWKSITAVFGGTQNDDIVGILVPPASVGQSYSDANRAIINKQGGIEGRMEFVLIQ
jgi:hypothetical protein